MVAPRSWQRQRSVRRATSTARLKESASARVDTDGRINLSGVSGYTVMPAIAGRGKDGLWDGDGQVGRVGSVVQILCIIDETRENDVLEPLFCLVSRQIGIVTVTDVRVVRSDQF